MSYNSKLIQKLHWRISRTENSGDCVKSILLSSKYSGKQLFSYYSVLQSILLSILTCTFHTHGSHHLTSNAESFLFWQTAWSRDMWVFFPSFGNNGPKALTARLWKKGFYTSWQIYDCISNVLKEKGSEKVWNAGPIHNKSLGSIRTG